MKKGTMLQNALLCMVNSHAEQFDRGGQPYALHPLKVMHYLKSDDEELQCIALLHDVVEDTDVSFAHLAEIGMSERVINAVRALTKMPGQTYEEYKAGVLGNVDAMRVKLCDLRHNSDIRRLKGVREKDIQRLERYNRFYIEIQAQLMIIDETKKTLDNN
jgi:GTP diphosphokinase / guanosine-3',5'-bis(diphosphate) 3'-diphosphatase